MTIQGPQSSPPAPMGTSRRYGVATASSVAVHALAAVIVGLLASRSAAVEHVLIPIEVVVERSLEARVSERTVIGGGNYSSGPPKSSETSTSLRERTKRAPSNAGGRRQAAVAPPRILTSRAGASPSGPIGRGSAPSGPGGQVESPAGPAHGPGVVGGPLAVYPKHALDLNLEGTVTVSVLVGADGAAKSVTVAKSSGHRLLDDTAVRALQTGWTFQPAMSKGKPVEGVVTITFVFFQGSVKRE